MQNEASIAEARFNRFKRVISVDSLALLQGQHLDLSTQTDSLIIRHEAFGILALLCRITDFDEDKHVSLVSISSRVNRSVDPDD